MAVKYDIVMDFEKYETFIKLIKKVYVEVIKQLC
jgi:hypothetical protein